MRYARPRYPSSGQRKPRATINKALLPSVRGYLEQIGLKPIGGAGKKWLQVCCPFHGEKNPSLGVHQDTGGFNCLACGAKGGDLIAFHMKLKGIGFMDACQELGIVEGQS